MFVNCVFQAGPSEPPAEEFKPWARLRIATSNQKGKTPMRLNMVKHVPQVAPPLRETYLLAGPPEVPCRVQSTHSRGFDKTLEKLKAVK